MGGQATGGKLQQRMAKLEEEQERMKEEKLDMKRQSYKKNIVLYGSDLPPQSVGENPLQLFIELIHAHYNIILNRYIIFIWTLFIFRIRGSTFCEGGI